EIVEGARDAVGPGTDQPDRGITRQLVPRLGQDVQRWLVIVAEQTMRVAGEAVARQACIENGDLAAGTAELQSAGETGKAAADDNDVIQGDGLLVVGRRGWARHDAQYLPSECWFLRSFLIRGLSYMLIGYMRVSMMTILATQHFAPQLRYLQSQSEFLVITVPWR